MLYYREIIVTVSRSLGANKSAVILFVTFIVAELYRFLLLFHFKS